MFPIASVLVHMRQRLQVSAVSYRSAPLSCPLQIPPCPGGRSWRLSRFCRALLREVRRYFRRRQGELNQWYTPGMGAPRRAD
jgi:hypothetical protein